MEKQINKDIILIGTAHVSKKSVEEVENAIAKYEPDIVAVELDKKRYDAITKKTKWDQTSIVEVLRSGKGFLLLVQTLLAMIQRKLGKEFGVEPGAEMVAAIMTAKKHEVPVALVDRDITITFRRAWKLMTIREKLRLFWFSTKALVGYDRIDEELEEELERKLDEKKREAKKGKGEEVGETEKKDTSEEERPSKEKLLDKLMDEDVISAMMEELRTVVPNATKALIDERDQYISKKIISCVNGTEKKLIKPKKAKKTEKTLEKKKEEKVIKKKKNRVLAVVGAGHLGGIEKNLEYPKKLPKLSTLEQTPKKRISIMKVIGYLIPILFGALFVYLIYFSKWETLMQVILLWFLINGICSAIGAAIAYGHPLTILTAFIAAPFTSLNPTIGAGWVAGYVEVKLRTPTVKDIKMLRTVETMRDFFRNRLIRVLMVMALANLGSMIGTFLAGYYIGDLVLF